ncbi:MAG: hypothetical protein ACO39Y_10060, partial [Ilumatobacteraceae bacterium]
AATHPHNVERNMIIDIAGVKQPAPAPRFSRTIPEVSGPPAHPGQHTREILSEWGFDAARIDALLASGAVVDALAHSFASTPILTTSRSPQVAASLVRPTRVTGSSWS